MSAASGDEAAPGVRVRALGEIAIRCRDRAAMERFYGGVLGLELLARRDPAITFFRIAEGYGGHTTVLALFEAEASESGLRSSLHHLALTVDWDAQEAAAAHLEAQGLFARIERFDWIGWRGVFTVDPEGNTVELVAARPAAAAG